jgi:RimJ/RimL family protein N-acetyltransferase
MLRGEKVTLRAIERAIRVYSACGFVEEGRMREHVWLAGRYVDNVIMGVMREEWEASLASDG